MELLIVVDMQNDFIDGPLGTAEAQAVVRKVAEKIRAFRGRILATRDTHPQNYLGTLEGKYLPVPHCIHGTPGWELNPEISVLLQEVPIDKPAFGSPALGERLQELDKEEKITKITLVGLCTDICVISNALLCKAFLPEIPVAVDAACCAGVTPKSHLRALEAMEACQVEIENR